MKRNEVPNWLSDRDIGHESARDYDFKPWAQEGNKSTFLNHKKLFTRQILTLSRLMRLPPPALLISLTNHGHTYMKTYLQAHLEHTRRVWCWPKKRPGKYQIRHNVPIVRMPSLQSLFYWNLLIQSSKNTKWHLIGLQKVISFLGVFLHPPFSFFLFLIIFFLIILCKYNESNYWQGLKVTIVNQK